MKKIKCIKTEKDFNFEIGKKYNFYITSDLDIYVIDDNGVANEIGYDSFQFFEDVLYDEYQEFKFGMLKNNWRII